ncbi:alanine racemase [Hydrogenimonas thermophila]|uniref:alanine racemase n=1 Tax=Hydrogenimonas thermophila TaxID=223786 RepID=UPI0029374098|nr:alanine racemase [Hydrogenimonas thermophila]WOE69498.1 alanine racemase [Hydrogenimonas thermophila]WOE72009.1 alanine racemase [Hydrogenimonas thermophila]
MSLIKISRKNFVYNINQIVQKTQSIDKLALVLKDNAYGHGLSLMASLAADVGVKHAVVRNLREAYEIEELFETVLVLSDIPKTAPVKKIRIVVNDLNCIVKIPKGTYVELKVDTGMHRNGVLPSEFQKAVEEIEKHSLNLVGIMTHFRSADEMGSEFFWQRKEFDRIKELAQKLDIKGVRWHSCNSAALFRVSEFDEDIARVGIAAFGCLEMPKPFNLPKLKPVMSLWADRISTRELRAMQRVGYAGAGCLKSKGVVSTYDIGYGDGWLRGSSSKPYILPNGKKILGRVSMDAISVETAEEQILIFDNAIEAAKQFDTIAYDILVKLSPAIRRIVV